MTAKPPSRGFSSTRLYIGNLSPSVDEYTLMQICSKHGKINNLDYLFHKSGPLKGKPRGYAFVEFSTKDEALRAMVALDDKLVRGKKISVTSASEQPEYDRPSASSSGGRGRGASRASEANRPTAISLLKTQGTGVSTNKKIAALEAKLAALQKAKSQEGTPEPGNNGSQSVPLDGDAFLDAIEKEAANGEGGGADTSLADRSSSGATAASKKKVGESQPKKKQIVSVMDSIKAGLPSKPKT